MGQQAFFWTPPTATVEAERRQTRLAHIIQDWFKDGCYEHGDLCQDRASCLSREIIARESAWV